MLEEAKVHEEASMRACEQAKVRGDQDQKRGTLRSEEASGGLRGAKVRKSGRKGERGERNQIKSKELVVEAGTPGEEYDDDYWVGSVTRPVKRWRPV